MAITRGKFSEICKKSASIKVWYSGILLFAGLLPVSVLNF
jgi:hypothetical protein